MSAVLGTPEARLGVMRLADATGPRPPVRMSRRAAEEAADRSFVKRGRPAPQSAGPAPIRRAGRAAWEGWTARPQGRRGPRGEAAEQEACPYRPGRPPDDDAPLFRIDECR